MTTRLKLWQVDASWHCLIVGTCLTPAEARAAAARAGHDTDGIEDFRVHHACVHVAADRSRPLARALHKRLEAKHARTARAFSRARTVAALGALWDEHRERGGIGGALWALATHPALDEDLRERVYGEVHMLQHACGHDAAGVRRADARRDARVESLEARLVEERAEAAARLEAERGRAAGLERRLVEERARRAPTPAAEPAREGDADARARLAERVDALSRANACQGAIIDGLRAREADARATLAAAEAAREALAADLARLESLVDGLLDARAPDARAAPPDEARPATSLCGRCVLVIGGDPTQCKRYRALVEQADGTFLHHDGGVEDRGARVTDLVRRADAVLCPTDRVSHEAMRRAKRACRSEAKPMIFLERGNIASFASGLESLVARTPTASTAPPSGARTLARVADSD